MEEGLKNGLEVHLDYCTRHAAIRHVQNSQQNFINYMGYLAINFETHLKCDHLLIVKHYAINMLNINPKIHKIILTKQQIKCIYYASSGSHFNIHIDPVFNSIGMPIIKIRQTWNCLILMYRKTSNIRRTLVGNKIVDHSDVVRALPVGAAPTTSSFST